MSKRKERTFQFDEPQHVTVWLFNLDEVRRVEENVLNKLVVKYLETYGILLRFGIHTELKLDGFTIIGSKQLIEQIPEMLDFLSEQMSAHGYVRVECDKRGNPL